MSMLLILGLLLAAPAQVSVWKSAEDSTAHCFYNYPDSIAACNQAFVQVKTPREQSHVLLAKGMLQANAKEYAMAAAALRQALTLMPRDPQAYLVYGWVLDVAGNHQAADAQYSQASLLDLMEGSEIQLDATVSMIIHNVGDAGNFYYIAGQGLERIGQNLAAKAFYLQAWNALEASSSPLIVDIYNAAVRVDPSDAATHYRMARFWSHFDAEHEGDLIHQLEEAVRLDPNDAEYRYELAHHYIENGNASNAIPQLQAALASKPDFSQAEQELELAIIATGDVAVQPAETPDSEEALKQFRSCVDFDGIRAEIACRRALKIGLSPHNAAVAHAFLAQELSGDGGMTEYHAALEADPNYALGYLMLAHAVAGNLSSAPAAQKEDTAPLLATAAKLRPDWVVPRQRLAALLWSRKQYDAAIAAQREAVALDSEDATLTAVLQQWVSALASYHEDLKHSAEVVQANPNDARTHQTFADALAMLGRKDEARNEYREAYKLNPRLGWTLASSILYAGFPEVACEIYPNLHVSSSPDIPVVVLQNDLGECARMFPNDTKALTRLAELQLQSGDMAAAQRSYEEAIRRDSDYFESHPQERSRYDGTRALKRP
jgi:tetratricopeptide (TPR) repeat protein